MTVTAWPRSRVPATYMAPTTGTSWLVPEIEREQAEGKRVTFRADAAFAKPEIYDASRNAAFTMRFGFSQGGSGVGDRRVTVPAPGRPSHKPMVRHKSFSYQAGSWTRRRPVGAW